MPLHSVAYRAWESQRVGLATRLFTVCETGIRRAYQSSWLKRLLFAAMIPVIAFAVPFFLFEQSQRDPIVWRGFLSTLRGLPQFSMLSEAVGTLPGQPTQAEFDDIRHDVWAFLLLTLMRYPQAFLMVLVVGIAAPPLISQDLRTRAYLIYFARPITRLEYICGKIGVISFFLLCISTLPALLLYATGVLLSPSLDVFWSTWDLPLRILLGSVCWILPTTLVALAFSALTLESRYAAFAWFAMWVIGHVTYSALIALPSFEAIRESQVFEPGWRVLTSPYQVLGIVQAYAFGFDESPMLQPACWLLVAASLVSFCILFRRVAAPLQV